MLLAQECYRYRNVIGPGMLLAQECYWPRNVIGPGMLLAQECYWYRTSSNLGHSPTNCMDSPKLVRVTGPNSRYKTGPEIHPRALM